MENKNTFYVTTPIYYVSGSPHLGHVYTSVACDIIARWNRKLKKEVFFLTGTDEHGQKIEKKAKEKNVSPKEFVDSLIDEFKKINSVFNISNDYFIRTTNEEHKKFVQEVLQKCYEKGDIYKAKYEGKYCIDCEAYYKDDELIENNLCPIHKKEVKIVSEENYFFKLSKYQNKLIELIENNKEFIMPISRRNETINRIKEGLEDISISRTKKTLSWGIELPFDKDHVTYVWFDALFNYISALKINNNFEKFWPANIHVIGKDILWFHTVYWPAFLMSAEFEIPNKVFAHGWWTVNGEKMGKSLGNVVDPFEVALRFGVDEFRYFMFSIGSFGEDQDFSYEKLISKINNELANDLGNLVSRTHSMTDKYFNGVIPRVNLENLEDFQKEFLENFDIFDKFNNYMQQLDYFKALNLVWDLIRKVNAYINMVEPWKEKDEEKLKIIINVLNSSVYFFANLIEPFMPLKAELIYEQFNFKKENFNSKFELIKDDIKINKKENLFKKWKDEDLKEILNFQNTNKQNSIKNNKESKRMEVEDKKKGFESLNLKVGKIVDIKEHPDSDKMYIEMIDIGEDEPVQIVSGLKNYYSLDEMRDKKVIVLLNLKPAKLRGVKSYGMVLVAENEKEDKIGLLTTNARVGSNLVLETGEIANSEKRVKIDDFFKMDFKAKEDGVYFEGKKVLVQDDEKIEVDRSIQGDIC